MYKNKILWYIIKSNFAIWTESYRHLVSTLEFKCELYMPIYDALFVVLMIMQLFPFLQLFYLSTFVTYTRQVSIMAFKGKHFFIYNPYKRWYLTLFRMYNVRCKTIILLIQIFSIVCFSLHFSVYLCYYLAVF